MWRGVEGVGKEEGVIRVRLEVVGKEEVLGKGRRWTNCLVASPRRPCLKLS